MSKKQQVKSAFLLFLFILIGVGTSEAYADGFRLAYVDLQKALSSSKAGQKAQKGYEIEVKKAQASIDQKKDEFEQLRKSFDKQRDSLNDKARQDKEEELLGMERDLKRSFKDSQDTLRRKNTVLVADLLKQMRTAVESVGRDKGFTVILEKGSQAVLYADNRIDITDEVVSKFDEMTH